MPQQRPSRILLHPGFHKTGTSSIQQFFWTNRVALAPRVGVVLLGQLREAVKICMGYSRDHNPLRLADLVDVLDHAFRNAGLAPDALNGRDMVISCEGLVGTMPGGANVANYAAAPITIAFIAGYLAERYPEAEVRILMTTRAPETWLNSVWRHQVVKQRQQLGWPEFRRTYQSAANFGPVIREITTAVAPAKVFTLDLDSAKTHAKGPGGAVLEMLDLPEEIRAGLIPVAQVNPGPEARLVNACLGLNQSDLPLPELRRRKEALQPASDTAPERRRA